MAASKVTTFRGRGISERKNDPFFLFLHFYDVHSDYRSEKKYERQFSHPSRPSIGA